MPRVPFGTLPDSARIWIFSADRPLGPDEREELGTAVDDFLDTWRAHGTPLEGGKEWRYDRFLLVGVDEEAAPPSGCSIDALVRVLKEKERELNVGLLERSPVWYRDGEEVRCVPRAKFRALAEAGEVGPQTPVFDVALTSMADLREGRWERPAEESWHHQLL